MPDKAGELIGSFSRSDPVGRIKKNNEFGIFGEYTKAENNFQKIKTANIDEIKPGKTVFISSEARTKAPARLSRA